MNWKKNLLIFGGAALTLIGGLLTTKSQEIEMRDQIREEIAKQKEENEEEA